MRSSLTFKSLLPLIISAVLSILIAITIIYIFIQAAKEISKQGLCITLTSDGNKHKYCIGGE